MRLSASCLLLVVAAALVAAPRTARSDAESAPKPLPALLKKAWKSATAESGEACEARRQELLAVERSGLSDREWVDLHLMLAALHRRATPEPENAPRPEPSEDDTEFDRDCWSSGTVQLAGERRFAWTLRHHHGLELSPRDVMRIGRNARRRVRAELSAFEREHGNGHTWREMAERQRDDHPEDHAAVVGAARRLAQEAGDAVERAGLLTIPDSARGLTVTTAHRGFPYAFAWYRPGTRDRDGVFGARYEVAPMPAGLSPDMQSEWLRDFDVHWLRVISGHEGNPGHHLQFSRNAAVSNGLRKLGYNSVFVEGWGFYAEGLLERSGHLDDPLDRLAMLRMRAWRAVRCYVDPGLHLGRVRPSQAVDMLIHEAGMSRRAAENEVRKYLERPTQPLGYWIGRRRIEEMRRRFLALHGASRESERTFHDGLLDLGCIPLPLAEAVLLGERAKYDAARMR